MKPLAKTIALLLLVLHTQHVGGQQQPLIRAGAIDAVKLLPAPAGVDSDEVKAELDLVLRLQERRTDKDVAMVRLHDQLGLPSFQSVFGPWLTAQNLPRLQRLLQRVEKEGKVQASAAKVHFSRPRPAAVDPRVKPVLEETNNGYPSGHAMRGQLIALILSELAPDKKAELLARGQEVGWSRVVGGVHFISDVTAGRFLGQAIARELFASPAFRAELELVKKEFNEARKGN